MEENIIASQIPLCVDLDGTLIATDTLFESIVLALKKKPYMIFLLPFWLLRRRAYFKSKVCSEFMPNPALLPYRKDVLDYVRAERDSGRDIVLATATYKPIADSVANHLGLFSQVLATDGKLNLRKDNKRQALVSLFGEKGYDYIGDSPNDIPVWESASAALLVEPSVKLLRKARQKANVNKIFNGEKKKIGLWIKEIRIYQWLKNLLIFLPLLLAHQLTEPKLFLQALLAFFAFSFTASSVYVMNDLFDLESDRLHPRKRFRPIASGKIPIYLSLLAAPILLLLGFGVSLAFLSHEFNICLLVYILLTSAYSIYFKRIIIFDIIVLASLYTLRLVAGAVAVDVTVSPWLLAFSIFLFLSLANIKRYTELKVMREQKKTESKGRGYLVEDIDLLMNLGVASGYISALILVLYADSNEVVALYHKPEMLWPVALCHLFWISRMWIIAHRGKMDDDPIVFTSKDYVSYIIGFIVIMLIIGATLW